MDDIPNLRLMAITPPDPNRVRASNRGPTGPEQGLAAPEEGSIHFWAPRVPDPSEQEGREAHPNPDAEQAENDEQLVNDMWERLQELLPSPHSPQAVDHDRLLAVISALAADMSLLEINRVLDSLIESWENVLPQGATFGTLRDTMALPGDTRDVVNKANRICDSLTNTTEKVDAFIKNLGEYGRIAGAAVGAVGTSLVVTALAYYAYQWFIRPATSATSLMRKFVELIAGILGVGALATSFFGYLYLLSPRKVENPDSAEENIASQGASEHPASSVLAVLVCSLIGATTEGDPKARLASVLKAMPGIERGFSTSMRAVQWIVEQLPIAVSGEIIQRFGYGGYLSDDPELGAQMVEAYAIKHAIDTEPALIFTVPMRARITACHDSFGALYPVSLLTHPSTTATGQLLRQAHTYLGEYARAIGLGAQAGKSRPTPPGVWITGDTGIGKSFIVPALAACLLPDVEPSDRIYARPALTEYWSGHQCQPMIVYDDYETNRDTAHGEILSLASSLPFEAPQADIANKGQFVQPTLLVVTTNMPLEIARQDINNNEAFMNRFKGSNGVCVHVTIKPGFAKDGSLDKVALERLSLEDRAKFVHLKFVLKTVTFDGTRITAVVTFTQFVQFVMRKITLSKLSHAKQLAAAAFPLNVKEVEKPEVVEYLHGRARAEKALKKAKAQSSQPPRKAKARHARVQREKIGSQMNRSPDPRAPIGTPIVASDDGVGIEATPRIVIADPRCVRGHRARRHAARAKARRFQSLCSRISSQGDPGPASSDTEPAESKMSYAAAAAATADAEVLEPKTGTPRAKSRWANLIRKQSEAIEDEVRAEEERRHILARGKEWVDIINREVRAHSKPPAEEKSAPGPSDDGGEGSNLEGDFPPSSIFAGCSIPEIDEFGADLDYSLTEFRIKGTSERRKGLITQIRNLDDLGDAKRLEPKPSAPMPVGAGIGEPISSAELDLFSATTDSERLCFRTLETLYGDVRIDPASYTIDWAHRGLHRFRSQMSLSSGEAHAKICSVPPEQRIEALHAMYPPSHFIGDAGKSSILENMWESISRLKFTPVIGVLTGSFVAVAVAIVTHYLSRESDEEHFESEFTVSPKPRRTTHNSRARRRAERNISSRSSNKNWRSREAARRLGGGQTWLEGQREAHRPVYLHEVQGEELSLESLGVERGAALKLKNALCKVSRTGGAMHCTRLGASTILINTHFFRDAGVFIAKGTPFVLTGFARNPLTFKFDPDALVTFEEKGAEPGQTNDVAFYQLTPGTNGLFPARDLSGQFFSDDHMCPTHVEQLYAAQLHFDEEGVPDARVVHVGEAQLIQRSASWSSGEGKVKDIFVADRFTYGPHLQRGDCGSILFTVSRNHEIQLLGIHAALRTLGSSSQGLGLLVSREDIITANEGFRTHFKSHLGPFVPEPLVNAFARVTPKDMPVGDFTYAGRVGRKFSAVSKTQLVPSPLAPALGVDTEYEPPVFSEHDPRWLKDHRPGRYALEVKAAEKNDTTRATFPEEEHLSAIWQNLTDEALLMPLTGPARLLTWHEVVNGDIRKTKFAKLSRMDMHTSEGFPYTTRRPTGVKGKRWLYDVCECKDCESLEQVCYMPSDPEFLERIAYMERTLRAGQTPQVLWSVFLKDELRPRAKIVSGDTRHVTVCPADHTMLDRKYFGAYYSFFYSHHTVGESSVGCNPYSRDFDTLFARLHKVAERGFDGDYSKFSSRLTQVDMAHWAARVNAWYKHHDPDWCETDDVVRRSLALMSVVRSELIGSCVYNVHKSQADGNPGTVVKNTEINMSWMALAYYVIMKRAAAEGAVARFRWTDYRNFVAAAFYGDDNIVGVASKVIEHFNGLTVQAFFADANIKYTPASKEGEMAASMPLLDLQYLGLGFTVGDLLAGCRVYASVAPDSLDKSLAYYRLQKDVPVYEILEQNVTSALMRVYPAQDGRFEALRSSVIRFAKSRDWPMNLPTAADMYERWQTGTTCEIDNTRRPFPCEAEAFASQMNRGVGFSDTQSAEATPMLARPAPEDQEAKGAMPEPQYSFESLASRNQFITTFDWTVAHAQGHQLFAARVPTDFRVGQLAVPFNRFNWYRGDLEITIKVNGNQFYAGSILAMFVPLCPDALIDEWQAGSRSSASVLQNVLLEARGTFSATMRIPFRHYQKYLSTQNPGHDQGGLRLLVWNALETGAANPGNISVTIFARFVDAEFKVLRIDDLPEHGETIVSQMGQTSSYTRNVNVGRVVDSTLSVQGGDDSLGDQTQESQATANLDLPNVGLNPMPVVVRSPFMSNSTNVTYAQRMALRAGSDPATVPQDFGTVTDELSISELAKTPTWLATLSWPDTAIAGDILGTWEACPGSSFLAAPTGEKLDVPLLDYLSAKFRFWSGPLVLHFQFVIAGPMTGRVAFVTNYAENPGVPSSLTASMAQYAEVYDLSAENTLLSVTVPFRSNTVRLRVPNGNGRSGCSMGKISLQVVNSLRSVESAGSRARINVYIAAGEGFQLSGYGQNNPSLRASGFVPLSPAPPPVLSEAKEEIKSQMDTPEIIVTTAELKEMPVGDVAPGPASVPAQRDPDTSASIRDLMSRAVMFYNSAGTTAESLRFTMTSFMGPYPEAGSDASFSAHLTAFAWWTGLFRLWRGPLTLYVKARAATRTSFRLGWVDEAVIEDAYTNFNVVNPHAPFQDNSSGGGEDNVVVTCPFQSRYTACLLPKVPEERFAEYSNTGTLYVETAASATPGTVNHLNAYARVGDNFRMGMLCGIPPVIIGPVVQGDDGYTETGTNVLVGEYINVHHDEGASLFSTSNFDTNYFIDNDYLATPDLSGGLLTIQLRAATLTTDQLTNLGYVITAGQSYSIVIGQTDNVDRRFVYHKPVPAVLNVRFSPLATTTVGAYDVSGDLVNQQAFGTWLIADAMRYTKSAFTNATFLAEYYGVVAGQVPVALPSVEEDTIFDLPHVTLAGYDAGRIRATSNAALFDIADIP